LAARYASRESIEHQYFIMTHSWRTDYHHGCGLLRQPRRHCGRHKRRITPLHGLLRDARSSPTQLCRNRHQQPSRSTWRDDKIIHSS
jgi:hypothetical protein